MTTPHLNRTTLLLNWFERSVVLSLQFKRSAVWIGRRPPHHNFTSSLDTNNDLRSRCTTGNTCGLRYLSASSSPLLVIVVKRYWSDKGQLSVFLWEPCCPAHVRALCWHVAFTIFYLSKEYMIWYDMIWYDASTFYSRQLCLCPFPAYSVFSPATQSTAVSHQRNGLKHAQQH